MPTLYENYITGDDGNYGILATVQFPAQTFTPSVNHIVSSVKAKLRRSSGAATPGTVTASIKATDGNNKPTGSSLVSGTYADGNTITTGASGEWIEFTFSTGYLLLSGTVYALELKCQSDDLGNTLQWRYDNSSATYAGGQLYVTTDEGVTWSSVGADKDAMFEEWGDPQGSGGGGAIYPINELLRASGIVRTFFAGIGGQAVYQAILTLGGISTTHVSPIGGRQPSGAVPSTVMSLEDYKKLRERALRGEITDPAELEAYKKVREQALAGIYGTTPASISAAEATPDLNQFQRDILSGGVTPLNMSLGDYKALRERALKGELSGSELEAYKKVREQALSGDL